MPEIRDAGGPADMALRRRRRAWLEGAGAIAAEAAARWALDLGAPFAHGGENSWVAPARSSSGADLVLKVQWPHFDAEHEADGLRIFDGDGAVRLHGAESSKDAIVLLMERCVPGTPLGTLPEKEQDEILTGLLMRLWRTAPPPGTFRPLVLMCDVWAEEAEEAIAERSLPYDPDIVRAGLDLFRELPRNASDSVLLCTDLHGANVLASRREPWLVIDPKPFVGDPCYDALQHVLNCRERLRDDPRGLVARMAGLLGLDRRRLELWMFARCIQESPASRELYEIARALAPA